MNTFGLSRVQWLSRPHEHVPRRRPSATKFCGEGEKLADAAVEFRASWSDNSARSGPHRRDPVNAEVRLHEVWALRVAVRM